MLKYIVGGIALIAVGYGLAKYLEDYGVFDEISQNMDSDDGLLANIKVQSELELDGQEEV